MIDSYPGRTIMLSAVDLQVVEHAILMRFASADAERRRAERMRAMVSVTLELSRALSTYSRHALVHCQGTAGASDLSEDTRWLTEALGAFCREIGAVSHEFSTVAPARLAPAVQRPTSSGPPRSTAQTPRDRAAR